MGTAGNVCLYVCTTTTTMYVGTYVCTYIYMYACIHVYVRTYVRIQGGPEKTAQTLMHYNFSTGGHRVMRFPAKCSETNW